MNDKTTTAVDQMLADAASAAGDVDVAARYLEPIQRLAMLDAAIERLNEQLAELGKTRQALLREDLPGMLDEDGLGEAKLPDGTKIEVGTNWYMSIPKKNAAAVADWLAANGLGDLVKTSLSVEFGRGDEESFRAALAALPSEVRENAKRLTSVNTGSVKAELRRMVAAGTTVPLELFGAFVVREAKVTPPR